MLNPGSGERILLCLDCLVSTSVQSVQGAKVSLVIIVANSMLIPLCTKEAI
jgi:hypothetical protein